MIFLQFLATLFSITTDSVAFHTGSRRRRCLFCLIAQCRQEPRRTWRPRPWAPRACWWHGDQFQSHSRRATSLDIRWGPNASIGAQGFYLEGYWKGKDKKILITFGTPELCCMNVFSLGKSLTFMHDHTLLGPWIILHMMKWHARAELLSPFEQKALCVTSNSARPCCFVTPAGPPWNIFFQFELREVVSFWLPCSNISLYSSHLKME